MDRLKEIFKKDELLINTTYERNNDMLTLTFKNINTGKKTFIKLPEPKNKVYVCKRKVDEFYEYMDTDKVRVEYVRERGKEYKLARLLGIKNFYNLVKEEKIAREHIYLDKRLYGADIALVDNVIREYVMYNIEQKDNGLFEVNLPLVRSFHLGGLDIETDIMVSDDQTEQPVIVNTYVDGESWEVFTRCLINPDYKGQKEIMEDLEGFKKELHSFLLQHIDNLNTGDEKKNNDIKALLADKINKLTYNIEFVTDEKDVIMDVNRHVFSNVNPDFLLIYNASYDIPHQMNRLEKLGLNKNDMFKYKDDDPYSYINCNNMNAELIKRFHWFELRNPTKIVDQMLTYYQMRRAKNFAKYSLDATAQRELGVGKLDYSKLCNYIGDFPYVAYKEFLIYNIIDVLVMLFIDIITNDTFGIVYKRLKSCTEWGDIAKPLPRVTNVFDTYAMMQGKIPQCNINPILVDLKKSQIEGFVKKNPDMGKLIKQLKEIKKSQDDDEDNPHRIEGGLVTSPNLIDVSVRKNDVYGIPINSYNKFTNSADLDATSMYPSNIEVNNGSKSALIGRIENIEDNTDKLKARKCALGIINENLATLGEQFFGLPSLHNMINEYYKLSPGIEEKVSDNYCNEEIVTIDEMSKEHRRGIRDLKKLWRNLYRTKYDSKDIDANNMTINKVFITSDNPHIEFSYYGTKIELDSDKPFNDILGIPGKGFLCGSYVKSTIENYNKDYDDFMKPSDEQFTPIYKASGVIKKEDIENIIKAKRLVYSLQLEEGYSIDGIDRLFFYDEKTTENLMYKIYDIEEDKNLFKCVITSDFTGADFNVKINQHFIVYRK